jgi:hypothetical protein
LEGAFELRNPNIDPPDCVAISGAILVHHSLEQIEAVSALANDAA